MIRRICLLGGLAFLVLATSAGAATFQYSGNVALCPDTGQPPCGAILFVGDSISGSIVVTGGAPNSSFSAADVTSFAFMVGDFFAVDSDNSDMVDGVVFTDGAGEANDGYLSILANALPGAPPALITLDLATATWIAYALVDQVPFPVVTASGFGDFSRSVVPIPGALVLLLPAIALLGTLRRK